MTGIAIFLIVVSSIIHVGWNLVSKRSTPSLAFFFVCNVIGTVFLLPLLIRYFGHVITLSLRVWLYIGLTGVCMTLYYTALAASYRSGEMSVIYPIARSIPIVFIALLAYVFKQGKTIPLIAAAGILLIVLGCTLLPLQPDRKVGLWRTICLRLFNRKMSLACLVALGTIGYTLVDDRSLRMIRDDTLAVSGASTAALIYVPLEAISTVLWHIIFMLVSLAAKKIFRGEYSFLAMIAEVRRNVNGRSIFTGIATWICYGLVLLAMGFASNVSYIAAFRQISIPLGALVGILFLKEQVYPLKITGIVVICAGLVLMSV